MRQALVYGELVRTVYNIEHKVKVRRRFRGEPAAERMTPVTEQWRDNPEKVIIVEGKTDKDRLLRLIDEPVRIVCTQGTLSYEKMEQLISELQDEEDVYVLVDADASGMKLRAQIKRELPNARHLFTRRTYREVATTPLEHLAKILMDAHFDLHEQWLNLEDPEL